MKVPLRWLADYVPITLPVEELAHRLSMAGAEVESIERTGDWGDLVRVGLVTGVEPHPAADRLRLATVDYGGDAPQTVVCGAPNVAAGQKIAFALEGASLHDAHSGKTRKLKRSKIRGVVSAGMVCSELELGLSDEHEGILVLDDAAAVGTPLSEVLGETVLDITPTPNRPDHFSVLGIAREVAALTGQAVREPEIDYPQEGPPIAEGTSVEIADPDLCGRYIATIIRGIRVGPSPEWLQRRLAASGQRPINNVVDVTNFVMLEMGQPLHAFDYDRLDEGRIVVRRPRPGEAITLLDGSDHQLGADHLLIADATTGRALAGVMGGADSEVAPETTNVLLEAAGFAPDNTRRTAAALKQRTEASLRFEKGLNPELAALASARAMRLLLETGGGIADHGVADAYPGEAAACARATDVRAAGAHRGRGPAHRDRAFDPERARPAHPLEAARHVRRGDAALAHRHRPARRRRRGGLPHLRLRQPAQPGPHWRAAGAEPRSPRAGCASRSATRSPPPAAARSSPTPPPARPRSTPSRPGPAMRPPATTPCPCSTR